MMRFAWCGTMTFALAALAATAAAATIEQPMLREIAGAPDPVQLRATVQALVGFGTRHTLSETASPRRGIGAARRWAQARFVEIGRGCGGARRPTAPSPAARRNPGPSPHGGRCASPHGGMCT